MHIAVTGVATGARVPSSRSCRGVSGFVWFGGRNILPPRVQIGRALGWVCVISDRRDSSSPLFHHAIFVLFVVSNWPDDSIRFGPRFPIGSLRAFPSHRPTGGARTLFTLRSTSCDFGQLMARVDPHWLVPCQRDLVASSGKSIYPFVGSYFFTSGMARK
mgnify:CR=1 FL=1